MFLRDSAWSTVDTDEQRFHESEAAAFVDSVNLTVRNVADKEDIMLIYWSERQ